MICGCGLIGSFQYRYCVFHVEYDAACQRKYDTEGKEIEPNFGQTAKVKTGYLNSSYSREPHVETF